ncbi:MAG: hypothetical protein ABIG20_02690 [archaeon]
MVAIKISSKKPLDMIKIQQLLSLNGAEITQKLLGQNALVVNAPDKTAANNLKRSPILRGCCVEPINK